MNICMQRLCGKLAIFLITRNSRNQFIPDETKWNKMYQSWKFSLFSNQLKNFHSKYKVSFIFKYFKIICLPTCQILLNNLPNASQILAKYLPNTGLILAKRLLNTCQIPPFSKSWNEIHFHSCSNKYKTNTY